MVTPPASTGRVMISSTAVTSQPQQKSGICISVMPGARMLRMVAMMLIEPMMELTPRMWIAKMAKSTPMPPCTDSGA